MALVTNIKGYINGDDWGIVESAQLMTYEQLIALTRSEAIIELNTKPSEYYNSLLASGHITVINLITLLGDDSVNKFFDYGSKTLHIPSQGGTAIMYYNNSFTTKNYAE